MIDSFRSRIVWGLSVCVLAACSPSPPVSADASVTDAGAEAEGGAVENDAAFDAPSDATDATDATDAANAADGAVATACKPCPSGQKYVETRCVGVDDPNFGCGTLGGTSCQSMFNTVNVTAAKCVNGACAVKACAAGLADCDGVFANGCETQLGSATACGACNVVCSNGDVCDGSTCVKACPFPKTNCGGACRDLTVSPDACGSCGTRCPEENGTPTCSNGTTCGITCTSGFSCAAAGHCYDGASDPDHCGNGCVICPDAPTHAIRSCVQGVCGFACHPGYDKCGGACVDLAADDAQCGACGTACTGGKVCAGGSCVAPTSLRLIPAQSPEDVIVDSTNVYYTDTATNEVTQWNKTTQVKTVLGTSQAKPFRLVSDGTYVYWTSNLGGAVLRAPIGGGTAPEVLYSATSPQAIAVDGTNVYWAADGIYRAPKAGGGPVAKLANYVTPTMTSDSNYLYLLENPGAYSGVHRIEKTTGTWKPLYQDTHRLSGLNLVDDEAHFFRIVSTTPWHGYATASKYFFTQTPLPAMPTEAVTDGCDLFVSLPGEVGKVLRYSGVYRKLAPAGDPRRLAADGTYVYWADKAGYIGRIAIP